MLAPRSRRRQTVSEVLVSPAAAVSSAANGDTRVQIEHDDGQLDTVKVITGLSADGFVEITGVDTDIIEGDRVVVGQ